MCFGGSSTTTQTNEPFSGERNNQFNDLYQQLISHYNNPATYSGSVTTPQNATQQAGIAGLTSGANNPTLAAYASGQYIDPSTNPYIQKQLDIMKQNSNDQFGTTAAGIDSRFANRGFYDGSSHVSALENAGNQSNRNFNDAATALESNAYNNGVGQMLSAQGALQSANSALANAGNAQWSQDNTNTTQAMQAWLSQQGLNQQDISNLLNYFQIGRNPTQTTTQESDPGIGGILGSIAAGWASNPSGIFCFVAGTKVSTPEGDRDIEEINIGDKVHSLDKDNQLCIETVTGVQEPIISPDDYVRIKASDIEVTTTSTQPFITPEGEVLPKKLLMKNIYSLGRVIGVDSVEPAEKELVYDLSTTGRNIYFANGLAAKGRG